MSVNYDNLFGHFFLFIAIVEGDRGERGVLGQAGILAAAVRI